MCNHINTVMEVKGHQTLTEETYEITILCLDCLQVLDAEINEDTPLEIIG